MGLCKYCNQEIDPRKMGAHVLNCRFNSQYEIFQSKRIATSQQKKAEIPILHFNASCQKCGLSLTFFETKEKFLKRKNFFCSRSCANSRICSDSTKEKIRNSLVVIKPEKFCRYCGNPVFTKRVFCSDDCKQSFGTSAETRKKISDKAKGNTGGWRNFGGNGKRGIYQGHLFQSSWELAWLIFQIENGKHPLRCEKCFEYITESGQLRKYYPDFEMDGIIFEIKGFNSIKTQLKISSVLDAGYEIKLLMKKEVQPCLDYCVSKYGEKFYDLHCIRA